MGNRNFAWSSLDKSAAMVLKPCRRPDIILAAAGLVIWSIDAEARVFMRNAEQWTDTIEFEIVHEHIADGVYMSLSGRKKIQPPRSFGGFVLIWGCVRADGSEPALEITYRTEAHRAESPPPATANCEKYRLLGTWGRYPDEEALIPQEISDREVTFSGDFTCDPDLGRWFTGGYVWIKKGFTYCVPLGLAEIYYVRGEARKAGGRSGLAQINFAQICDEGSKLGGPTMQMRTQVKGASVSGEPVSLDNVPIRISQTSPDFCILVGPGSEGTVLSSGYRLKSDSHSRKQDLARPSAPCWRSRLSQFVGQAVSMLRNWLAG